MSQPFDLAWMQGMQWEGPNNSSHIGGFPASINPEWKLITTHQWSDDSHKRSPFKTTFVDAFQQAFVKTCDDAQRHWWQALPATAKYNTIRQFARMWWYYRGHRVRKHHAFPCSSGAKCRSGPLTCSFDHSAEVFDSAALNDNRDFVKKQMHTFTSYLIFPGSKKRPRVTKSFVTTITREEVILFLWNKGHLIASAEDVFQFLENVPAPTEDQRTNKACYFKHVEQLWVGAQAWLGRVSKKQKQQTMRKKEQASLRARCAKMGLPPTPEQDEAAAQELREAEVVGTALYKELLTMINRRHEMISPKIAARLHCGVKWETKTVLLGKRTRDEEEFEVSAPPAKKRFTHRASVPTPEASVPGRSVTAQELMISVWKNNLASARRNGGSLSPVWPARPRSQPPSPPAKIAAVLERTPKYTTKSVLGKRKFGEEEISTDSTKKQKVEGGADRETSSEPVKAIEKEAARTGALLELGTGLKTTAEPSVSFSPSADNQIPAGSATKSCDSRKATESAATGEVKPEPASASTPEKVISKTPNPVIGKKRRLSDDEEEMVVESESKKARVESFSSDKKTVFSTSTNSSRASTPAPSVFSPPTSPIVPISPASSTPSRQQSPADDLVAAEMIVKSAAEAEEAKDQTRQDKGKSDAPVTEKKAPTPAQQTPISSTSKGKANPAGNSGSEPPPPPPGKDLNKVPEDKVDVPSSPESGEIRSPAQQPELDNAEDLGKEGAIIIDYHAAPITRDELAEVNSSIKLLMQNAGKEERNKHRNWLVNEVRTRGLSDDDPEWCEMVFKRFRIEPELRKPRGVVIS